MARDVRCWGEPMAWQFARQRDAPDDADMDDRCLCMATAVLASKPQTHSYTTASAGTAPARSCWLDRKPVEAEQGRGGAGHLLARWPFETHVDDFSDAACSS